MSYSKSWQKCLKEIQGHTSMPVENWNYYQLLGYLLSQTSQNFEPVNLMEADPAYLNKKETAPSRHPMVECVRYIFRQFDKCPIKTKAFLDWCLSKYKSKLSIKGLRQLHIYYLNNNSDTTVNSISIPNRSDELPDLLKTVFADRHFSTYGDLAYCIYDEELSQLLTTKLNTLNLTIDDLHLRQIV